MTYFRASSHDLQVWIKKKQIYLLDNVPPGQNTNSPYSRYKKELQIQKGTPDTDLHFSE
jgi:hypothetical protein